jgi:AcrR family transcriptional regulator
MARQSAQQRREHVIEAAIYEFAAEGYHAGSTTAIARRAGISQPYIYALFENKQDLFLAAYRQVTERIKARLVAAAADGADPEERLRAMGEAYLEAIKRPAEVLCQLQAYAAAGEPSLRGPIREEFLSVFEAVREAAGASREETAWFFAGGIFLAIAGALGVPREFWPRGAEPAEGGSGGPAVIDRPTT